MAGPPRISAVVHTLNAGGTIGWALGSLTPWVDEIVVVDMHSEDDTREQAEAVGARVVLHERLGFADPARRFGLEQASGDWLMVLDADELVPARLSRRLVETATEDAADVVRIPRLNYMLGDAMRGGGWEPESDVHLRFFKRGTVRWSDRVHGHPVAAGGLRELRLGREDALVHFAYATLTDFVERMNRYTSIEAGELRAGGRRYHTRAMWADATRVGLRRYFRQGGRRAGWRGSVLGLTMVFYRLLTHMKLRELELDGDPAEIEQRYEALARDLIGEYASMTRE